MAKTKQKANGGIIRKWKKSAIEALGDTASHAALVDFVNAKAKDEGFDYTMTQWESGKQAKPRKADGKPLNVKERIREMKQALELAERAGGLKQLTELVDEFYPGK